MEDEKKVEETLETEATETAKGNEKEAEETASAEEAKQEVKQDAPVQESEKYLRLLAEYDNYRKRTAKEKADIYADTRCEVVTQFLPVYDNLARALAQTTEDEAYRKGIEMTMNQLNAVLEKLGVTRTESLGKTFDPKLHNAVMHVEDETKGENEIVDVFQEGFLLGEKVIRFAMVRVAN